MNTGSDTGTGGGPGRRGRFFDDLAGMAGGAFSVAAGLRAEVESMARSQLEVLVQRLDLVKREDLDAALEVARRAREESSALAQRVAALEAKLGGAAGPKVEPMAAGAPPVVEPDTSGTSTPKPGPLPEQDIG
ncbi:accessory factor UbiK family protein [Teichococcus vastitatis]|uniref:Accessory factor UbiK family protein n=1 Tax=Teichococcus vastitatis TaxID=2307076 RepID=A0ABS9W6F0_9PROT|nr:accessory factor UbiK family protein [Pseudoroseomonas vastitatis]MCI0754164.1 accessory factor UbiK family protein [Pseudoroseomonas vastitatis]